MYDVLQRAWAVAVDESGQDLIEYALLAFLIGLGAIVSIKSLATVIRNTFTNIGTSFTSAV